MGAMSLSVTDGVATFTNEHGLAFTATDVLVEHDDVTMVEIAQFGPYFVVQRDGVEIQRYPLRHGNDPHYSEMRAIHTWANPFLPPTDPAHSAAKNPLIRSAKRAILAEHYPVDPSDAHALALRTVVCGTVAALAAIYSDHPDFDPSWEVQ